MKNFVYIAGAFFIGMITGSIVDSKRMANDQDYHDYWMKKMKNPE